MQSTQPVLKFSDHTAAVKAIAWSPHQHGVLASGGGTADRCIRFWNTAANSGAFTCVDTGSQVYCSSLRDLENVLIEVPFVKESQGPSTDADSFASAGLQFSVV